MNCQSCTVFRRHCHCHLWTVLLATGLFTELHILHTCAYMPLICVHGILSHDMTLYFMQMCICTGPKHTKRTMSL